MEATDVFAKAEVAYERGLARRALLAAWPAALIALALVCAAVIFLYLGRGFARVCGPASSWASPLRRADDRPFGAHVRQRVVQRLVSDRVRHRRAGFAAALLARRVVSSMVCAAL